MDSVSLKDLLQRAKEARLGALPVPAVAFICVELLSKWPGGHGDLSPDQVRLNIYGEASCPGGDIESLNRLLYLMLTGEPASDVSPKVINPHLPDAVVAVALASYPSPEVMKQALARWLAENAPGYAHDDLRGLVLELFPELRTKDPVRSAPSRAPLYAAGVAVVALLFVGLAVMTRSNGKTLQACLEARVEGDAPPELARVQKDVISCLQRPLSSQEVSAVDEYVCTVQRRAIAQGRADFIPVTCAGAERASNGDVARAIEQARADLMRKTDEGYVAARGELQACVRIDPRSAECHRLLGDAFKGLADLKHSAQEYQQFLDLAPKGDPSIGPVKMILESMHVMATP